MTTPSIDTLRATMAFDATSFPTIMVRLASAHLRARRLGSVLVPDAVVWEWTGGKNRPHSAHLLAPVVAGLTETLNERIVKPGPEGFALPYETFTGDPDNVAMAIYLMDLTFEHVEWRWAEFRAATAGTDDWPSSRSEKTILREVKGREFAMDLFECAVRLANTSRIETPAAARLAVIDRRIVRANLNHAPRGLTAAAAAG